MPWIAGMEAQRRAETLRLSRSSLGSTQAAWAIAYGISYRCHLQAVGLRDLDGLYGAKLIAATRLPATDPVRIGHLRGICRAMADSFTAVEDAGLQLFWHSGAEAHGFTDLPAFLGRCMRCRQFFYTDSTRRDHCNGCRRRAERDKQRRLRGTDLTERTCPVCSVTFTPRRSDARCCSAKCRAKLSRQQAAASILPVVITTPADSPLTPSDNLTNAADSTVPQVGGVDPLQAESIAIAPNGKKRTRSSPLADRFPKTQQGLDALLAAIEAAGSMVNYGETLGVSKQSVSGYLKNIRNALAAAE
ncbi:MAG: hypothetical protein ACK5XN_23530 [Bacteroidota bacterium]